MAVKKVLFVCTGNICRSPMAKVLLEKVMREQSSPSASQVEVDSCGINPVFSEANGEAVHVMQEYGLDLTGHRSKQIDNSLVEWADIILVMGQRHRHAVLSLFPSSGEKTHLLSEYAGEKGDIADPYSCALQEYRRCAARLDSLLRRAAVGLIS